MELWITVFRDLGFPAAVAVFVLYRLDRRLQSIERALYGLLEWHRRYAPIPTIPEKQKRG